MSFIGQGNQRLSLKRPSELEGKQESSSRNKFQPRTTKGTQGGAAGRVVTSQHSASARTSQIGGGKSSAGLKTSQGRVKAATPFGGDDALNFTQELMIPPGMQQSIIEWCHGTFTEIKIQKFDEFYEG